MRGIIPAILMFLSTSLSAFNPSYYDLNRPVGSKISVNFEQMENVGYVSGIVKKLNEAIAKDPDNVGLYVMRNEYLYLLWDIAPVDKKIYYAKLGLRAAEETIKKFPDHPDGWINKAIFLGVYGLSKGVLNALSVAKEMRICALKAYKMNKTYYYAQPPQILGRLYFKLPSFPVSFGDLEKARRYLYEAYRIDPTYPYTYMYIAELEAATGNIDKAKKFILDISNIKPRTYFEVLIKKWTLRTQKKALHMLGEKLDRYNYDFLLDPLRHQK